MELTGKIIVVAEPRKGVSQRTGNPWMVQEFVLETHEQFPRKCMFTIFGEERLQEYNLQLGEEVTITFDIDAREYNGRWFNDIRVWKVSRETAPAQSAVSPVDASRIPSPTGPIPSSEVPAATEDDLPF